MLLGIISDSHDNLPKINAAVAKLNSLGVEQVLHAGDYCAPFAALAYKQLKSKMVGVLGNNDAEKELLQQKFQSIGHDVKGRFASVEFDNLKIALVHGDEPGLLQVLAKSHYYDLVVFGHTHAVSETQDDKTTVLNPGEICGYLSGRATIATFESKTRRVEIIEI